MRRYTVGYVPIRSARSLRARCEYIADEHRRSHSLHRVVDFAVHGAFKTAADWIGKVAAAYEFLRAVPTTGRQLARIATMYCVRFAAGTYLSDNERARISDSLRPALQMDHGGCSAWHVHKHDGESDLHAIVAHVEWASIPLVHPRSVLPHLPTLRKVVATTMAGIAEMRLEMGVPPSRTSPAPESMVPSAPTASSEIEEGAEALGPNLRKKLKPKPESHVPSQDTTPIL